MVDESTTMPTLYFTSTWPSGCWDTRPSRLLRLAEVCQDHSIERWTQGGVSQGARLREKPTQNWLELGYSGIAYTVLNWCLSVDEADHVAGISPVADVIGAATQTTRCPNYSDDIDWRVSKLQNCVEQSVCCQSAPKCTKSRIIFQKFFRDNTWDTTLGPLPQAPVSGGKKVREGKNCRGMGRGLAGPNTYTAVASCPDDDVTP